MGLLDRLKPAPLLRSGPLLLLPSGTSPDTVDALVASWAPMRRRKGDHWQLADGLRWVGPVEVTMSDVTEHDLPGGYPIAYVAQAKRSRGDGLGHKMVDRLFARSFAKESAELDRQLIDSGEATAEELDRERAQFDEQRRRDYPQGYPVDAEGDAWKLVCGLARRLGGRCRLPDGDFFLPAQLPDVAVTLYARTLLDSDAVAALLAPVLGTLTREESEDDGDGWLLVNGTGGDDEVSVEASVWDRDPVTRIAGHDPVAAFDAIGGLTVEYDVIADENGQALTACALLAPHVDGVVIDAEGFPLT